MTAFSSLGTAFILHFLFDVISYDKAMEQIIESPVIVLLLVMSVVLAMTTFQIFVETLIYISFIGLARRLGCDILSIFVLLTIIGLIITVLKIYNMFKFAKDSIETIDQAKFIIQRVTESKNSLDSLQNIIHQKLSS